MTAVPENFRLAVFASGGGTNLQALLDACRAPEFPARVVAVVVNVPGVRAIERAQQAGVPALVIPHQGFAKRRQHEAEIVRQLATYRVEQIVLAGYMRVLTPVLLDAYRQNRWGLPGVVNIHPADTRAYQGAHGYEFALGLLPSFPQRLSETRITVHFVDSGVDTGPIIFQTTLPVSPDDTLDSLRQRGLALEHRLYPEVIRLMAEGCIQLNGREVHIRT